MVFLAAHGCGLSLSLQVWSVVEDVDSILSLVRRHDNSRVSTAGLLVLRSRCWAT
jgi:hypothetical protein